MKNLTIAIDGPSGVGKSTAAKLTAQLLGITYIDTGAMYRAVALYNLRKTPRIFARTSSCKNPSLEQSLNEISIDLKIINNEQRILLNGEDISEKIRTQEVSDYTSRVVAVNETVRQKLVEMQQCMATKQPVVMDGRDIGSKVLPFAPVKIYLDAAPEVRAKRRALEMEQKGEPSDFGQILAEIIERDERDKTRPVSPLIKTEDAVYIDTGNLTPMEVAKKIVEISEVAKCTIS